MKIIISGICGKMGKILLNCAKENSDIEVVAGIDRVGSEDTSSGIRIFSSFSMYNFEQPDVIIDFSSRGALVDILQYATKNLIPTVLATTGYNLDDLMLIDKASKDIPIFKSGNMSNGVAALINLVKKACSLVGEISDIEIVETHHNQKSDAPSGTALMIAEAIKSSIPNRSINVGRDESSGKRDVNEVGMHSIRGGSVVGKHEIMFLMNNELITITHEAESKTVFAYGSIKAASFLIGKNPGLYSLLDM